MKAILCALALAVTGALAQDPADGWMAYAVGTLPAGAERITHMEMKWKVLNKAKPSFAFFSPWFGADPADNLNLIQPVNPWTGDGWQMYTEYFQWEPEHNSNSRAYNVFPGETLFGQFTYMPELDSYNLTQTIMESGKTSSQIVKCQDGKKYTIPYVVFEKVWPCKLYPSDEVVTFYDIKAECDNADCTDKITWEAKVKDANCDMTAHVPAPGAAGNISITWDTTKASVYDSWSQEALYAKNLKKTRSL